MSDDYSLTILKTLQKLFDARIPQFEFVINSTVLYNIDFNTSGCIQYLRHYLEIYAQRGSRYTSFPHRLHLNEGKLILFYKDGISPPTKFDLYSLNIYNLLCSIKSLENNAEHYSRQISETP